MRIERLDNNAVTIYPENIDERAALKCAVYDLKKEFMAGPCSTYSFVFPSGGATPPPLDPKSEDALSL